MTKRQKGKRVVLSTKVRRADFEQLKIVARQRRMSIYSVVQEAVLRVLHADIAQRIDGAEAVTR